MSKYINIPTCEECGEEVTIEEAYEYATKLYNIDDNPDNKVKAIEIMEQCARAGYAKAQNSIFAEYLSGEFIPQNIDASPLLANRSMRSRIRQSTKKPRKNEKLSAEQVRELVHANGTQRIRFYEHQRNQSKNENYAGSYCLTHSVLIGHFRRGLCNDI